MPDLSHRPSRYATVAVAVFALGVAGFARADVSVGGQAQLDDVRAANVALQAERDDLELQLAVASAPTCETFADQESAQEAFDAEPGVNSGWDGDKDGVACEQLPTAAATTPADGASATCLAFATQEDSQKVFDADPAAHAGWDGDGDGLACEQLKSAAPAAGAAGKAAARSQTCAAFATQEAAQKVFAANRAAHPDWDGDTDGVACEQLKSGASAVVTAGDGPPSGSATAPATETSAVGPGPISSFTKAEILGSGQHFGMYAGTTEEYDSIEASLARDTTIRGSFQGFDTDFRPATVQGAWQRGEIPMITWESRPLNSVADEAPYSLANIVNGSWDAYLTKYAQDVTATGLPLILRFNHEMNGTWYRWSESNPAFGNSPGSYIAAWQRIHDIFEANGANEYAIWNWAPNRVNNSSGWQPIENFYPGDAYVDWLGITGYVRTATDARTFRSVFGLSLAQLRAVAPGKRILLAEVGATETGGDKVAYVQDFFTQLSTNPDIVGFVWFNYAVSENGATNDWRINSSTAVTDAFRAGLYSSGYGREQGKTPFLVPAVP